MSLPTFPTNPQLPKPAGFQNGAGNSLARSNASIYGNKEDLYDRLRKHAYQGKKGEEDWAGEERGRRGWLAGWEDDLLYACLHVTNEMRVWQSI